MLPDEIHEDVKRVFQEVLAALKQSPAPHLTVGNNYRLS
jgi:hypothetical protein